MGSKRKRDSAPSAHSSQTFDTSKPTAVFKPTEGRKYTLSVALPGSIIKNAQSPELKTLLAGTIARALAVFCIDEVVVFDDSPSGNSNDPKAPREYFTGYDDPSYFLMHIFSYLESPPFLRTRLFPIHPDLKHAGLLPSLDMPHHLRANETCPYREGISVRNSSEAGKAEDCARNREKKGKKKKRKKAEEVDIEPDEETTHLVDVGFPSPIHVSTPIPLDNRVTVHFSDPDNVDSPATLVLPSDPRTTDGFYWGYFTRAASSISSILTECPFDGGYDVTLGTSERGVRLSQVRGSRIGPDSERDPPNGGGDGRTTIPPFKHMLIAFGGVSGLETAVAADPVLKDKVIEAKQLFDFWVDVCPGQGSRTIRTEEAVWVALAQLKEIVETNGSNSL